jgi:hypothetical protein
MFDVEMHHDRFIEMACNCGATWIEDRMELAFSCPLCGREIMWSSLSEVEGIAAFGPSAIDFTPAHLTGLLERAGFAEDDGPTPTGRIGTRAWSYCGGEQESHWDIRIMATWFVRDERLRSVLVLYSVAGMAACRAMILTMADLMTLLSAIACGIQEAIEHRPVLSQGVHCGFSTEEATG